MLLNEIKKTKCYKIYSAMFAVGLLMMLITLLFDVEHYSIQAVTVLIFSGSLISLSSIYLRNRYAQKQLEHAVSRWHAKKTRSY
jgi:uncharacterized membrane protein YjjP (DUF1212 family)